MGCGLTSGPRFVIALALKEINELYASMDGLGSSFNVSRGSFSKDAIGVRGLYARWKLREKETRVKIDVVTEEIIPDKNGFAVKRGPNEAGETIHQLDPTNPDAGFSGYYKNKNAGNERKARYV
jgi:hypothetical protein